MHQNISFKMEVSSAHANMKETYKLKESKLSENLAISASFLHVQMLLLTSPLIGWKTDFYQTTLSRNEQVESLVSTSCL